MNSINFKKYLQKTINEDFLLQHKQKLNDLNMNILKLKYDKNKPFLNK